MDNSYISQSGDVIPWLANNKAHDVQRSLAKIVQTGSHGEISLAEFMQATNYSFRTNTCVKINYNGENQKIVEHFNNFKKFNKEKKFTNPRKMGQLLKNYMLANPGALDEVYEKFKSWLGETGSQDTTIDTGVSQFERTGDYRKFIELLDEHYSKFGTQDFIQKSSIAGYLVNRGISVGEKSKKRDTVKIDSLNVILEGVAGCGKTYYQKSLFNSQDVNGQLGFNPERSETVVFHPSTSYEDFVSGLRPQKGGGFSGKAGIFVELCNRAAADPENNYLLFIDEINRANTAKVFGDLLMVIEEAKRTPKELLSMYGRAVLTRQEAKELQSTRYEDKDPEHAAVRLQTAVDEVPGISEIPEEPLEYLAVPNNLYIVGTMNSTDRSVGTIDLALRRRFTWHTMEPKTSKELENEFEKERQSELSEIFRWYAQANIKLQEKVGPDARLGHSYFYQNKKTSQQIAHDLLKQLAEIFYIFHLEDLIAEEPFNRSIQGLQLINVGEGLGQKVIVEQVSANNSGKASGKPEQAESGSGKSPENPQES